MRAKNFLVMHGIYHSLQNLISRIMLCGYHRMAGAIPKRSPENVSPMTQSLNLSLGEPFHIKWIECKHPLKFHSIKSLPKDKWRPGQAIKASRDGTEISPESGEVLMKQFGNGDIVGYSKDGLPRL